jgi:hypothetical protein
MKLVWAPKKRVHVKWIEIPFIVAYKSKRALAAQNRADMQATSTRDLVTQTETPLIIVASKSKRAQWRAQERGSECSESLAYSSSILRKCALRVVVASGMVSHAWPLVAKLRFDSPGLPSAHLPSTAAS